DKVAEILESQPIEVYEIVTFYTMYAQKTRRKYPLECCRTSCCMLRGAEDMMDYTCQKLGVKENEVTPDGMFSVHGVECLGACGYAPMLLLVDFNHELHIKEKYDLLIEYSRAGNIILYELRRY